MALTTAFATNVMKLLFQAVAYANVADNASSSPLTNIYISAHTADPGLTGTQTTSETSYTAYSRQAVPRSASGFSVVSGVVTFIANVVWPISTSGTPTLTNFGYGASSSGAGTLWGSGTITPNAVVSTSVPQTLAGGLTGTTITLS